MRVLFALNSYEADGPGRFVYRLCGRVRELGVEVATVALSRGGPLLEKYQQAGIEAQVVETRGSSGGRSLKAWAKQVAASPSRPDIIHSHLLWPDLAVRMAHRELHQIPIVSTNHGMHAVWDKGRLSGVAYTVLERSTRHRCSAWIAISESTRNEMIDAGYPAEKIVVVKNGIDCREFSPLSEQERSAVRRSLELEENAFVLFAAGNLIPLKGHDVLFRAMPQILAKFSSTQLLLAGEGVQRAALEQLARELNVEHAIQFLGSVGEQLPRIMASCDVVVHPSRIESFGLVVAEAQACGVPVVATRAGGIPEVLADEKTGFLVNIDDSEELSGKVIQLLGDQDLRAQMGRAGVEHARQKFDIAISAAGYVDVWNRVIHANQA